MPNAIEIAGLRKTYAAQGSAPAKQALKGDERRLISSANMHLPGRQIDPKTIHRDIWRLGRWERERLEAARRAPAAGTTD